MDDYVLPESTDFCELAETCPHFSSVCPDYCPFDSYDSIEALYYEEDFQ